MMTLRDLFDVFWTVTEVSITARKDDGEFLHQWIYGENINETLHMYHDRMAGKLTLVDGKINAHGDPTRGGSEIGWGVKTKLFPKDLLDAPITHMGVRSYQSGTNSVSVDVTMHPLTVAALVEVGEGDGENE